MSPALVIATGTITGQVVNASGVAVAGIPVVAKLYAGTSTPQSITPAGQVVPTEIVAYTDTNGFWSMPLVPNNNISPSNTTYTISVPGMPDVSIQLNDTSSHAYLSLAVSPTGATLAPAGQTITGVLTLQSTLNVAGPARFAGPDPWADVTHPTYGADPTGATSSTAAFAAAMANLVAAGGGTLFLPPGIYSGVIVINSNVPITISGWGAILRPPASGVGVSITQANGTAAVGCTVQGLDIDGQSLASTTGVLIQDTDRAGLRDVRISNCTTGVSQVSNLASRWAEDEALIDVFISNCTTGISFSVVSGTGSFGESSYYNIGITGCATGIACQSASCNLYRTYWENVVIWLPTNGVGFSVNGQVTGAWFGIAFENLNGTQTNLTGLVIGAGVVNLALSWWVLSFTGTFVTQVSDPSNLGLAYSWGTRNFYATANAATLQCFQQGDANPRIQAFNQFAGGGGIKFGPGVSGTDTSLYRVLGGVLKTDGAICRGPQAPAFASTYTPDPTLGEVITMTLTGPITVNAPANGATKGVQMQLIWTQDGTGGRVISYNALYHTGGGAALVTTANTVTIDTFMFDGSVWRLVARITGQA